MPRLFGTDGVRGLANGEIITADLALGLAQAAARVLTQGRHAEIVRGEGRRSRAVLARDPRVSGEFISAAVAAGLASSGIDVLDAGVIPTPAAAFLVGDIGADFGVMVSASHNPAPTTASSSSRSAASSCPTRSRTASRRRSPSRSSPRPAAGVGRIRRFADAKTATCCTCSGTDGRAPRRPARRARLRPRRGSGRLAGGLRGCRAREVTVIGAEPDGLNINDGVGSTHPTGSRPPCRSRCRRRHRPRRRRRPVPRRRRRRATSSTATGSWRSSPSRPAASRPARATTRSW